MQVPMPVSASGGSTAGIAAEQRVRREHARSVARRPLPPPPPPSSAGTAVTGAEGSLVLFYQYREPPWTESEHKKALKEVLRLASLHNVRGRGRVAPEGVNCTLSCASPQSLRDFCRALRDWDDLFQETDFKFTDHVPRRQLFKSLSIRKTTELVAYGLDHVHKAPCLSRFAGQHLDADAYHELLQDPDAIVIDVRNAYETALGRMNPPPDGATLLDPQMRNSSEWSAWLADRDTQQRLHGKKVLMYCTGGIRCERATALLNEMSTVNTANDNKDSGSPIVKPQGVYELQGGIERYLQTYPQGGYWKGKNYLFDRRMEQVPAEKPIEQVEAETDSLCCQCRQKWTRYRGQYKCGVAWCAVPVIVCDDCQQQHKRLPNDASLLASLRCELCRIGYRPPSVKPDLVQLKQRAEEALQRKRNHDDTESWTEPTKKAKPSAHSSTKPSGMPATVIPNRLFLSRLPLTVTRSKLASWLGCTVERVQWLRDPRTGFFYGSCLVQVLDAQAAERVLARSPLQPKLDDKKQRPKVQLATENRNDGALVAGAPDGYLPLWPPPGYDDTEYPPVVSSLL